MSRIPLFEPHSRQLLRVDRFGFPSDTRFFVDGKRVSRKEYDLIKIEFPRHDCLLTKIDKRTGNVRHWTSVRKE